MQANKMSESTKQELRRWLSQREPMTEGVANSQHDLRWLDKSLDMSTIQLGNNGDSMSTAASMRKGEASAQPRNSSNVSGGGILAFFGCAGKRK
jgi:hypothetical protein